MKPILAVTMGDPGGIGPEIILKSLQDFRGGKVRFLIIGNSHVFKFTARKLRLPFEPNQIYAPQTAQVKSGTVNLYDPDLSPGLKKSKGSINFDLGSISKRNGQMALKSIQTAAEFAAKGFVSGIVTAPVNKTAIRAVRKGFVGHTEFLADYSDAKDYAMLFYSRRLRVTLVTIHAPLSAVSRLIKKKDIITKIALTHHFLKERLGLKKIKIGVSALNPHGSEFGSEEMAVIGPAVRAARKVGLPVIGPLPGDQIFYDAFHGKLDAVVAMYHDQGLAPFKMIAFNEGVNVTLGLPYVRTSPDHGTAFDIAYKNLANPSAMSSALRLAADLIGR